MIQDQFSYGIFNFSEDKSNQPYSGSGPCSWMEKERILAFEACKNWLKDQKYDIGDLKMRDKSLMFCRPEKVMEQYFEQSKEVLEVMENPQSRKMKILEEHPVA